MIISVYNQKGGTGKTTTATNLAAILAMQGKKVLQVDIDPQGNSTSGLGFHKHDMENTIYELMKHKKFGVDKIQEYIYETPFENLHLIGANKRLKDAEMELINVISRETILSRIIAQIKEYYDYIIVDCPPTNGLLSQNAMVASDYLIIPISPEYFAVEGVVDLIETFQEVQDTLNPKLEIMGVLLTQYDERIGLSKSTKRDLRSTFGDKMFKTVIRIDSQIKYSQENKMPVVFFNKNSRGFEDYKSLGMEVLKNERSK